MNTTLLIILGLLGFYAATVAVWVRGKIRKAPGTKGLWIAAGLVAAPLGAYVALMLPEQIDFNRESPGGIFYVYLPCFLIGGGLAVGWIGAFLGAIFTTPRPE